MVENTTKFDIVRIADTNELARIEEFGVASIGVEFAIDKVSAMTIKEEHQPNSMFNRLLKGPKEIFDAIAREEDKSSQIVNSNKGNVKLLINVPKGDLEAARSGLDGIAEGLVDDDDAADFVINLRNGEAIKPDEIAIKKQVRLDKMANSVLVTDVWNEMNTYMSELRNAGQLEV